MKNSSKCSTTIVPKPSQYCAQIYTILKNGKEYESMDMKIDRRRPFVI